MSVIVSDLKKAYGTNVVLNGFSHEFTEGKVTAVTGPSGCGKSTLLALIMGLLPPDSGAVQCSEPISAVFQENRLCDNLTVSANIRLVTGKKYKKSEIAAQLSQIGLNDCENKAVRELSGGMKRRVALLRALMADFETLLLDEPFKGLDNDTKRLVMEYCKEKTAGKTVILVTHDDGERDFFSDEVIELGMNDTQNKKV